MVQVDLKKEMKALYSPSAKEVSVVDVQPMRFAIVDGEGDPNTAQEYKEAVEALYAVSYNLKFKLKKSGAGDYVVMPLEGLWWADDMTVFTEGNKEGWKWTMMIVQPDPVTPDLFNEAVREVEKKKGLPALAKLRLEEYREGRAAQIMHIGPYSDEGPTIARLHAAIEEQGCKLRGKHHEIYLSDPRKSAPEKMRTVIRQPFE